MMAPRLWPSTSDVDGRTGARPVWGIQPAPSRPSMYSVRHIGATVGATSEKGLAVSTSEVATGYNIRAGAVILADRVAELETCATCAEPMTPSGRCLNVGGCRTADRMATRTSLRRGAAASARPAAWTRAGSVD